MQMKVPFDQGYNDIGVAIATKWRYYLFYLPHFSAQWELFFKIIYQSFPLQYQPRCSWSLTQIYKIVIEIFWDEVFMVRNTLKIRQSWCSAIISGKRSAFEVQFYVTFEFQEYWYLVMQ